MYVSLVVYHLFVPANERHEYGRIFIRDANDPDLVNAGFFINFSNVVCDDDRNDDAFCYPAYLDFCDGKQAEKRKA